MTGAQKGQSSKKLKIVNKLFKVIFLSSLHEEFYNKQAPHIENNLIST